MSYHEFSLLTLKVLKQLKVHSFWAKQHQHELTMPMDGPSPPVISI